MQIKLSKIALAVAASTLLVASSSVFAHNYKGEGNYKGEAMAAPAAPCVQPLVLKDGFYLGAAAAYDTYRSRNSNNVAVGTGSTSFSVITASEGFGGNIFAGYGMTWNNFWYLGAEVFGGGSSANQVDRTNVAVGATTARVATKFSVGGIWGVSALPGLKVNDSTLLYARLGYEQAKLTGKSSISVLTTVATTSKSNWQGGFQYGLGLETAVYPNLSLRGEYNHTSFNSFTNGSGTSFNPSVNEYEMGLSYHFA